MIAALLLMMLGIDDDLPSCDQAAADRGIQIEMNICAAREFVIADAKLNEQWAITREYMKQRDADFAEYSGPSWDDRPGYFDTLLAAQRAWLEYRDAHCQSEGYFARGGSLEPLLISTCKTTLTNERIGELQELIKH